MKNKKGLIVIGIICLAVIVAGSIFACKSLNKKDNKDSSKKEVKIPKKYEDTDYISRLVKTVNSTQDDNYLISPYSIEMALSMLRDGALGNSKDEIDQLIGTREIPTFNVKDRISVANAAFIKDKYKDFVNSSYYQKLNNYNAELVFDKFEKPDEINKWVKEKTYGMIDSILDKMDESFVMGLANAVAIDVNWGDGTFNCESTISSEFVKEDNSKMNVEMMHKFYEHGHIKYFETDEAKGVILPYQKYDKDGEITYNEGTQLEFVGILPNGTVNEYIEGLTKEKISKLDEKVTGTNEANISLALPRFSYDFSLDNFKEVLISMGVNDVFSIEKANLTNIISKDNLSKLNVENIYVDTAIHKTYIDLNEYGTKAAAVTYFGMAAGSAIEEPKKTIDIEFDKPFLYMIRDSKTKEILFFGVVRTPNVWKGSTCSNEE